MKKTMLVLLPPALICCVLLGYFSPLVGGAVFISPSRAVTQLNAIELSARGASLESVKININTADLDILCQLPGIGTAIAQRIIDYRTQNHLFSNTQEIQSVKGIGDEVYNKIRLLICTE